MRTAAAPRASPVRPHSRRAVRIALAAAAALVTATAAWGAWLDARGEGISLHAAPLFAAWQPRTGPALAAVAAIAALVVWRGPKLAADLSWRRLCAAVFLGAVTWGVGLALLDVEGATGLVRGVSSPADLLADVDRIQAPGPFLDTFSERIGDYVVHVRGHPPGLVVALWWLGRVGLGGAAPFAAIVVGAAAVTVVAALATVREVAGEAAARAASPFLVLTPAAVWLVVSADAVYAMLAALGTYLVVAAVSRRGVRSDSAAVAGGLALGAGLYASYGLLPLLLVPVTVCASRRRVRPAVVAGAATVAVGVAFAAFGFSWIEGLWATRTEYAHSVAAIRPYSYFVLANLAAFAIVLGPAPVAGLASLRDKNLWLLAGPVLVAVIAADLSGLSKGEVERIWLPFWPWLAVAAAAVAGRPRAWLAAQAGVAVAVQSLLGTPW